MRNHLALARRAAIVQYNTERDKRATNQTNRLEQVAEFARMWQRRADDEAGKTRENGWSSTELEWAAQRRAECLRKRDECWAEVERLRVVAIDAIDAAYAKLVKGRKARGTLPR